MYQERPLVNLLAKLIQVKYTSVSMHNKDVNNLVIHSHCRGQCLYATSHCTCTGLENIVKYIKNIVTFI